MSATLLKQLNEAAETVEPTVSPFQTLRDRVRTFVTVNDATPEHIVQVAPQLTLDTAAYLLKEAGKGIRLRFAGPPICSLESYQCYSLSGVGDQIQLQRVCTFRAHGSSGVYTGAAPIWFNEALDWAVKYAPPGELLSVAYPTLFKCEFIRPGILGNFDEVHVVTMVCSRSLAEILQDDEEPLCEVLDDATLKVAHERADVEELEIGHTKTWLHFCGACGGQLNQDGCTFCPARWAVSAGGRKAPPCCVPKQLANYVAKHLFDFAFRPSLPRAREHERWARTQFVGYKEAGPSRPLRVIDVGGSK
jgi:hypothetical protein